MASSLLLRPTSAWRPMLRTPAIASGGSHSQMRSGCRSMVSAASRSNGGVFGSRSTMTPRWSGVGISPSSLLPASGPRHSSHPRRV